MAIECTVPKELLEIFRKQAEQKITVEGWAKQGRNAEVKIDNFVHCWVTEEAFKQILISKGIWFRYRGMYFGDSQGAGADFTVKIDGKEVTVGLRSIAPDSLEKWKSVAYPDDRFRLEQDKIADHHIVCNHKDGFSRFFGIISKEELLKELEISRRLYSRKNQEYFRVIPLEKFRFDELEKLLEKMERV
ncbi:hypothetical protein COV20_03195 [Candidatus Woesearchaeota archaeon CG10_big_fil_rev_8_21_14_0_10_45_16]|nr:MAG: hypothetical protein COV20_03195 [Candidatus Woesearchaeota archaeon CG10_big_fil_rev_8_21_14_0_10_45_16]